MPNFIKNTLIGFAMIKEISDIKQLEDLVTGDVIPLYIKNTELQSETKEDNCLRLDYSFCWRDEYQGKRVMIFARGADSTHILAMIMENDWFEIQNIGLVAKPPKLMTNQSFGYSYVTEDKYFGLLFRAITGKNPSEDEIQEFRSSELYQSFFLEL